ncbi:MAG: hypothetical protein WC819_01370 [Parcubacteria group bacterium]
MNACKDMDKAGLLEVIGDLLKERTVLVSILDGIAKDKLSATVLSEDCETIDSMAGRVFDWS